MPAPIVTAIPARPLDAMLFAPYGEVIYPRAAGSQFDVNPYDPETSAEEARLTLSNGTPRLWIMRLKKNGLAFSKLARHRRVSQCLGSLQGKEWFVAVAPPNDTADGVQPELARLAAFRIPGDCVIKLHVATWHAGPHFTHSECLFFNLENLDTNKRDFEDYDLPNEFRITA
ncbi:MAG TPA: ureidoglycolate lyase [Pseudolabrys sp.]|nr:ureidoglycolate lyase [Pseudolabrys sp.]